MSTAQLQRVGNVIVMANNGADILDSYGNLIVKAILIENNTYEVDFYFKQNLQLIKLPCTKNLLKRLEVCGTNG